MNMPEETSNCIPPTCASKIHFLSCHVYFSEKSTKKLIHKIVYKPFINSLIYVKKIKYNTKIQKSRYIIGLTSFMCLFKIIVILYNTIPLSLPVSINILF